MMATMSVPFSLISFVTFKLTVDSIEISLSLISHGGRHPVSCIIFQKKTLIVTTYIKKKLGNSSLYIFFLLCLEERQDLFDFGFACLVHEVGPVHAPCVSVRQQTGLVKLGIQVVVDAAWGNLYLFFA